MPHPPQHPPPPVRRRRRTAAIVGALLALPAITIAAFSAWTDHEIRQQASRIVAQADRHAPPRLGALDSLPPPVARYLRQAVPGPVASRRVEIDQQGDFRRPRTTSFNPTTARQIIATGSPAMLFDATTWVLRPLLWARAYDAYADGQMTMKAKVLSAVAVVDEMQSPELNQISLRRWLLESPLYPVALLPGGPVRWEPIDARRARARVSAGGLQASLVATFGDDGLLASFHAEEDGDLSTPYHGSGEHVQRSDYQPRGGMLIPMRFTISRMAAGQIQPFWRGQVTGIQFY